MFEYVLVNFIGDLYIGYVRNVVVGDVLVNILIVVGYNVICEYYINDVGN